MKKTLFLTLLPLLALSQPSYGQDHLEIKQNVPLDKKTKGPKNPSGDAFASELFIDGQTNIAVDTKSQAAQTLENEKQAKILQQEIDRSIRADIATGQPITLLIAPEHFTQLTILKDSEIVYPKRAFTGQPDLVIIDKKENSPYLYLAASAMVEGQTTNLFIETEEDGKIQTYVVNLLVTEPKNIREQVSVNLVDDRTPPIRGGEGSSLKWEEQQAANYSVEDLPKMTNSGVEKFSSSDIKKYFNTMIEMAQNYPKAKQIEKKTGRSIYRDTDIQIYPSGINSYIDPIEGGIWNITQAWYFPKYDAVLLDVSLENKSSKTSFWDYSQVKWQANQSPKQFESSAAAPLAMQTPSGKKNRIWYLIQGNRLDPRAEFSPVFPREERRGSPQPQPQPQAKPQPQPQTKK